VYSEQLGSLYDSQAANWRAQEGLASIPQQNVLKLYLVKGFYQRNVVECNFSIKN
jgi:hypothetical protein